MVGQKWQRIQLTVAGLALAVWVAWLANQAFTRGRFPVVSHTQLLVSTLDIVAEVTAGEGSIHRSVVVDEVLWPKGRDELVGKTIQIENLATATLPGLRSLRASGRYVIPLIVEAGKYTVAAVPKSPGFPEAAAHFVYPDTLLTRRQFAEIPKP